MKTNTSETLKIYSAKTPGHARDILYTLLEQSAPPAIVFVGEVLFGTHRSVANCGCSESVL